MQDKSDFLKELYFHELDRKKSLEAAFALPTGIVAGLFGMVGYYFTKFNFGLSGLWQEWLESAFLFTAVVSVVLLLGAAYWLARAVIGSEYEHLPGAETMLQYWEELEKWHADNSPRHKTNLAREDFDGFLVNALAGCCQKNWKSNLYRSGELYRAKRSVVWALFAIAILSILYYMNFWLAPDTLRP